MCETEPIKPKRCGKHHLKLAGKPRTFFKETTIIDFTPLNKTKKIQKKTILPTYNNDRKFFTPAFILPSLPLEADEVLLVEHSKRVQENTTQISQIMVPKPRSRQKYCGVCREFYQEYILHVNTKEHMEKLRTSQFQAYILEATQLFREQNDQIEPQLQKQNSLETSYQNTCCSNEEDLVEACLNLA